MENGEVSKIQRKSCKAGREEHKAKRRDEDDLKSKVIMKSTAVQTEDDKVEGTERVNGDIEQQQLDLQESFFS